ncbi:MAG: glycosyltransferase [Bryobacterales bacterium]|nr:glycosyltransferase [Bryobacterales bacterium]
MITIAIPNYNGGRYLGATLQSVARNRPYVRFWFQDALSSDGSLQIAQQYCTEFDRVVSEADSGQADALNRAFQRMGGDIIGFLNSDDLLAEGAAEAVLAAFEEDPELDIVYGQVEWIDADGKVTGHHQGDISTLEEILNIYEVWWNRRQWVQPEVFWRRPLWDRVGQFNTRYDLAFDYDYWVRCFLAGANVRKLPRVLARFRLHPSQKSTRADQASSEIRQIVAETLSTNPSIDPQLTRWLTNMLSYDRYRLRSVNAKPTFAQVLLANPQWLSLKPVQHRIWQSLRHRCTG